MSEIHPSYYMGERELFPGVWIADDDFPNDHMFEVIPLRGKPEGNDDNTKGKDE